MPAAVAPPMQSAPPPAPGHGRLVVDVVDGPVTVKRVRMEAQQGANGRFQFFESPEVLCAVTPCATDFPVGNVLLGFPILGKDASETELVHIGPETAVYRRALSVYDDGGRGMRTFGIVMTAVGGTAMFTGTALLPIGLGESHNGLTWAGAINLGAGAVVLTLGILTMRKYASTYRPGSSNHFPLAQQ